MPRALGGADPAIAGKDSDAAVGTKRRRRALGGVGLSVASDARLAKRAACGDPEAFAAIFRRYERDLYRFCVGILREPQDAQDAVQNTMVRAMRALPGERRDMQLKPWLYRIAHNEAVELRRRERPVETLDLIVDERAAGPEEQAEQDDRLETLLADIADLPERLRATLVMREVSGLEFGEIGAALGSSPGAVRQALYEARCGLSQMELGRQMACDAVMRQVSDTESGRPGRREIRAHLRDCVRCRRFQTEIRERRKAFASIAPVPAIAAVGMLKGIIGGSSAAVGGGGAAAGVGAGTSAGLAAAGSAGIPGLVKAGVVVLAALAVGTAAVDHGAFVGHGGVVPLTPERRQVDPREGDPMTHRRDPGTERTVVEASAGATRVSIGKGTATVVAHPAEGIPAHVNRSVASPGPGPGEATDVGPASGTGGIPVAAKDEGQVIVPGKADEAGQAEKSTRPEQQPQENGLGTESGTRPQESGTGETSPVKSAGSPGHPEHPAHPEHPEKAKSSYGASVEAAGTTPSEPTSPESPAHPEHPSHPEKSDEESAIVEVTEPVEVSSVMTSSPEVGSPPNGKAKGHEKEAGE
ncbi:MAG: sigma-70 family RNA polymerase sigma factor [Actinobacteria bacterium]|nr:sigma-70 family RNA polymerase sigma factor [Actinomycetota bacterium]